MLRFEENIFKRVGIFHGFIRPEHLEECLEEGRSSAHHDDLGQLLLKKGYLKEDELTLLEEVRRKKARKLMRNVNEIRQNERVFGLIALERGLITLEQLERAILEQENLRRKNLQFRLGEVLVKQGAIPVSDVLEILAEQRKRVLLCAVCDDHYTIYDYRPEDVYRCKNCGGS